jgi:hypothetical protein
MKQLPFGEEYDEGLIMAPILNLLVFLIILIALNKSVKAKK